MTADQITSVLSYWPGCLYLATLCAVAATVLLVSLLAVIGMLLAVVGRVFNLYSGSRTPGREEISHEVVSS